MKIGILTFHWATNHGGILQAYALQKYLSEAISDSEVLIIDYWPAKYQKSIKRAISSRRLSAIINNLKDVKKENIIAPFRSKINKTYRYYSEKQLRDFPPPVDILITGSDQVWNEFYTMKGEGGITTAYFLPFQPNAKRISYAASFGFVTLKPEMEKIIKPCLEKFDAISVREQTGKAILDKIGIDSVVVCDPTLLLKSENYEKLCQNNIDGEYIAEYVLRAQSRETMIFVSEIEKEVSFNKNTVRIGMFPIEEWLGAIKDASCLVTNSFHGVVFALKFHTPFFVVSENKNLKGMNDRFHTLLDVVGLKDRVISNISDVKEQLDKPIDWESVDRKLDYYAEISKNYLLSNCTESSGKKTINFYKRSECCGCGACAQICPRKCIEMVQDTEGFLYPKINESECVRCGKCYNVCHIKNDFPRKGKISETYYAKNVNRDVRVNSSSGGIFAELAESVLSEHGVVFGAAFSSDWRNVNHIAVQSSEELYKLIGSKYVQSEIGESFVEAKEYLESGKKVLFAGTPCQIHGLYSFLNKDYTNLVTIEVICHGVPSKKVWDKYLDGILEKQNGDISNVSFRFKEPGWRNYSLKFEFEGGSVKSSPVSTDPYMQALLNNLSLRPSCYDCGCKDMVGVSDITLGDAWGIENYCKELDDNMGTSVIFVRTSTGKDMINRVSSNLQIVKADGYEECLKYNPAICSSVVMPNRRSEFFEDLNQASRLDKIIKRYCKTPIIIKVKRFAKKILKG